MRHVWIFLAICVTFSFVAQSQLVSGELIPVGAGNGMGPLAAKSITTEPMGAVTVTGGEAPDLIVRTGRFGIEPGLFLYPFSHRAADDVPVFKHATPIAHPFGGNVAPEAHIFENSEGAVIGLWLVDGTVAVTTFARDPYRFVETHRIALNGLPRSPSAIAATQDNDGGYRLYFAVGDGTQYRPDGPGSRDPEYNPYDGRGIWRGGHPYTALYSAEIPALDAETIQNVQRESPTDRDVRSNMSRLTSIDLGNFTRQGVLAGSHYGDFHFFAPVDGSDVSVEPRAHAVGLNGIALRHPIIHPSPIAYPDAQHGRRSDIVAGGEGGLFWYRFTGALTAEGKPVFEAPREVLEEHALLYAGSLPVPNMVDWDGDGDKDIVTGNSEGFILFLENVGSDGAPKFAPGTKIEAGGRAIHVQPGYRLDIQGPGEARWGYTCPTVADWNDDGLPDIVMSDSTARHIYFENVGTATAPKLDAGMPIYYDGLDLYGTWRVQPAVGRIDGRMAYIALDDDDAFHLYWRQDPRNVTGGFKLRLDTGEVIQSNFIDAGGTGRLKLTLYDWDKDGLPDLIVGTPRHGSVPNPETGLPQSLGLPGSSVLFLKNTGTSHEPRFAFPKLFAFKGKPIHVGQHACGPAVADFGQPNGPGLLLGEESGRFYYFDRADLSLWSPPKN